MYFIECICDKFIDGEGFGDCIKRYKNEIGCYVKEPSTCKDTKEYWRSHDKIRLGLYSLSEACEKQQGEY